MTSPVAVSSASDRELPPGWWALTWVAALALFTVGLVAAESTWRALDNPTSVPNSPALWNVWYHHATSGGKRTVVVIGASRIQVGISATQLRHRLPGYRVVQLGQNGGGSPIGVLRALACEEAFKGIVVCDTITPFLFRSEWEKQRQLYEYRDTLAGRGETAVSAYVEDNLALKNGKTGIHATLRSLVEHGRVPSRERARMHADRSLEIDFAALEHLNESKALRTAAYRRRYEDALHRTVDDLRDEVGEISEFVRRIQTRGGQVVFLRMPSSGERLQLEEEYHPRAEYWDRFRAMGSGIWIHSADLRGCRNLKCPDDSHLDHDGAVSLTDALVDHLLELGLFKARFGALSPTES